MKHYETKPRPVMATQWLGGNTDRLTEAGAEFFTQQTIYDGVTHIVLYVGTPDGVARVRHGDWILRRRGVFTVCGDDEFRKKYRQAC